MTIHHHSNLVLILLPPRLVFQDVSSAVSPVRSLFGTDTTRMFPTYLMEEILHHLFSFTPAELRHCRSLRWCKISSIHRRVPEAHPIWRLTAILVFIVMGVILGSAIAVISPIIATTPPPAPAAAARRGTLGGCCRPRDLRPWLCWHPAAERVGRGLEGRV